MTQGDVQALDVLVEPALVVLRRGDILAANGPARRMLDAPLAGRDLFDWVLSSPDELDAFLRRAGGATSPQIGAVTMRTAAGAADFRVHGARLRGEPSPRPDEGAKPAEGPPRIALRLIARDHDPIVMLQRRVRELDVQLRRRHAENLALDAALARNRALVQEVQHRVKNTIQLTLTLLVQSARGRETPEVSALVEVASLRLQALASAQEAIYRAVRPGWVSAVEVFADLLAGIEARLDAVGRIRVEVAPAELPEAQAHVLALAASELVTNALRHGLAGPDATVRVVFAAADGEYLLEVADDGPGLPPDAGAARSGLGLVRRLSGQIGGALELATAPGTTWRLRFAAAEPC